MNSRAILVGLLFTFVILAGFFAQAAIREAEPVKMPANHLDKGDCKSSPTYPDPNSVIITVSGNDITVLHADAFYNCCLNITTQVVQEGYIINLYEDEWGEDPCFCMCYYDLETTIYDLAAGTYTISVYDDQGQYVGGGTATIEGEKRPYDPAFK